MSDFNFTNRKEIPRDALKIDDLSTVQQNQLVIRDLDLSVFEFPDNSRMWLEAQRNYLYQRFDLGWPTSPSIGSVMRLESFEPGGLAGVSFRLLVVDQTGKLLGSSRPFKLPTSGRQSTPLLDMQSRDIGQEVWQLELAEDTGPLLLVNSNVPDPEAVVSSVIFISCVLPTLLKQIAVWMMSTEIDENPDTAPGKWMTFFKGFGLDVRYEPGRSYQEITDIADEAARLFATAHELFDMYVHYSEGRTP